MKIDEAITRALRAGDATDGELKLAAYILATEYTQLRDKLPQCWRLDEHGKLVQDALMVPGMEVWLANGGKYPGEVVYVGEGEALLVNDSIHWSASPLGLEAGYSVRDADTLYGSREAAEAPEGK